MSAMVSSLVVMAVAALLQQPCDALKAVSLPRATLTAVEFVAAGSPAPGRGRGGAAAALPAYCRVAVTLAPSADSHIEMELWLPAENWNGKFLAVGNGGWAGHHLVRRDGGRASSWLRNRLQRHRP